MRSDYHMSQISKKICKNKWKQNDIENLKSDYQQGVRIKVIAGKLGRTETAVQKALTRFGVRPQRKQKRIKKAIKLRESKVTSPAKAFKETSEQVSFTDVIHYLMNKGQRIRAIGIDPSQKYCSKFAFLLNDQPASKMTMLIAANKLRLAENKSVFRVWNLE